MELSCKEIQSRHSSRIFDNSKRVETGIIDKILHAATLAPSGKNLQPWRFRLITDKDLIFSVMEFLPNNRWIRTSDFIVMVYLDLTVSYDYIKDVMSVGASIENMILEAQSNGVSSCWIGECIENQEAIRNMFKDQEDHKLMAIIAFGFTKYEPRKVSKKSIDDLLL